MRVIVTGSCDFDLNRVDAAVEEACANWERVHRTRITEVVCKASGHVDEAAEWWSEKRLGQHATRFAYPQLEELLRLGIHSPRAAGPICARRMVRYAQGSTVRPGGLVLVYERFGAGTARLYEVALRAGLLIWEQRVPAQPLLRLVDVAGGSPELPWGCRGCHNPLCPDCAESSAAWGGQS